MIVSHLEIITGEIIYGEIITGEIITGEIINGSTVSHRLDLSPFALSLPARQTLGPSFAGPHHEGVFDVPLDIHI